MNLFLKRIYKKMVTTAEVKVYSPREEKINVITHGIGCLLSIIALIFLEFRVSPDGGLREIISATAFGVGLVLLYSASTLYHCSKKTETRKKLKIFDHAAIYILIAGSYTPFTLLTLHGTRVGETLFIIAWSMAVVGVVLKLFFTGKYSLLSTLMYLLMGWIIVFAIKPLFYNLPVGGFVWLLIGGAFYTGGAFIYGIKRIPFNHAIWHVCVLIGSLSHFISIYFYVL